MTTIEVTKKNEANLFVTSEDTGVLMEISENYTFFVPGYKFMPAFKNKIWDGKVRLYDMRSRTLPYGLLNSLADFALHRGYLLKFGPGIIQPEDTPKDLLHEFVHSLPLTAHGKLITPRDYQIDAFCHAIRNSRAVLVSPTASGKSLIIYLMLRWFLANEARKDSEKVLIVVPTTSLVEQMSKDFAEYSAVDDSFDAEKEVHKIYSGKEKINISSRVVVTTWQSAIKMTPAWFNNYSMVIGDEAHNFKAKSLTTIMNNLTQARFRIGTTGTLDGAQVHELVLTGSFGKVYRVTSTKALIDDGSLAPLKITCLALKYSAETRKIVSKYAYKDEIDFLVSSVARNKFIVNLALGQKGNTLVLYNLVEKHGKVLHRMLTKACAGTKRKVFFVSGAVNAEEREAVRELTEKETDAIIVASMGTFSTGVNIRNLHNLVMASPTKSQIRLLQSIGRGLRISDNGWTTNIYDISDDLSWKKNKNFTLNHALERIRIYDRERFDYRVYELDLAE
jgi:superfamily II DNA or RNA helicase